MSGPGRKDLIHSLLIAALFMALGLALLDRMIGDPAALNQSVEL